MKLHKYFSWLLDYLSHFYRNKQPFVAKKTWQFWKMDWIKITRKVRLQGKLKMNKQIGIMLLCSFIMEFQY